MWLPSVCQSGDPGVVQDIVAYCVTLPTGIGCWVVWSTLIAPPVVGGVEYVCRVEIADSTYVCCAVNSLLEARVVDEVIVVSHIAITHIRVAAYGEIVVVYVVVLDDAVGGVISNPDTGVAVINGIVFDCCATYPQGKGILDIGDFIVAEYESAGRTRVGTDASCPVDFPSISQVGNGVVSG